MNANDDITAAHFFAGVLGLALVRQWYIDGAFNAARIAELTGVLDRLGEFPFSLQLNPEERTLLDGYAQWAADYDGPNPLIEAEEPVVRPLLAAHAGPGIRALDAACGTARHAAFLAELGCETVGVDQSQHMLEIAKAKVPSARFEHATLNELPFSDATFDLAVCSLALCHLADPAHALVELARVLRSGGVLVISDPHPEMAISGGQAFYGGIHPGRPMTWVRNHSHHASTWLRGFRAANLAVTDCLEPVATEAQIQTHPVSAFYPDAARGAIENLPSMWIWSLTKTENNEGS